jgi:hypothetical protein
VHPDQGGWPSGRLIFNMQFPYQMSARSDHDWQASRRLKLNAQFLYLLNARPDHADRSLDGFNLNCNSCLMYERVRMGNHVVRTVASIFPYLNLKIKSEAETSERVAETSGRMQARTEASRYSGGSGRKSTSSGRMMLDLSGVGTDGTVDR